MPQYLSPGVYVEEVPSAVKPIAGVGTSTVGFIGVVPSAITIPSATAVVDEAIGTGDGAIKTFDLKNYPVLTKEGTFRFRVHGAPTPATLSNDGTSKKSKVTFTEAPAQDAVISGDYIPATAFSPAPVKAPKLCTNFTEFKKHFGDFSTTETQTYLAHAVYGFFNNGGTRCYVMRVEQETDITADLLQDTFAAIDEIALVAAPGITTASTVADIVTHCRMTQDRFAILDSAKEIAGDLTKANISPPPNSDYAAFYFPWLQVFDPATKIQEPKGDGLMYVPPSGHIAGIYARVDANRGVHKAPANEVILGALGLKYAISKAIQDGLNPDGINCIRELNGNIRVWGARTIGGDANGEWRYVNVRRLLLFLRESIDEGTQWVVFEPNEPGLWAKITRNVTAFLTNVWRAGALFGSTPQEAFYVKCDAETNPPALRDLGQVVTEIGVAVVKPAEFVIFRISQWAGPGK